MAAETTTCAGCIASLTAKSGTHSDDCDLYTPAFILTPDAALAYGRRAASGAARRYGIAASDAADDILSAALLTIAESGKPYSERRIAAACGIIALRYATGRTGDTYNRMGAERDETSLPVSIDRATGDDGGTLSDTLSDSMADPQGDSDSRRILTRVLPDGSVLTVPTDRWGADVDMAVLTDPTTGATVTGRDALDAVQVALLADSRGTRHGAAVQAVRALTRDGAILATAGMAWQDALAALAEQGIALSRAAYRVSLMRARQRQDC